MALLFYIPFVQSFSEMRKANYEMRLSECVKLLHGVPYELASSSEQYFFEKCLEDPDKLLEHILQGKDYWTSGLTPEQKAELIEVLSRIIAQELR